MTVRPSEAGREAPERDPDLIHLVPRSRSSKGSLIAHCGFDCTGRTIKPYGTESCVVCIDLARRGR